MVSKVQAIESVKMLYTTHHPIKIGQALVGAKPIKEEGP